jgi:hypothetical protein
MEYAAILARPPADRASISEGICNKCGKHAELILAGCVCGTCCDALDLQWVHAKRE